MKKSRNEFTRQITVDKEIVSLLSKSTYQRNFPYALRELVSNAYDADATSVSISINQERDEVVIRDNGNGMTLSQFDFYLKIAGRHTAGTHLTPKFQRERIGHFGIGFLAIFPFCNQLEIVSTAENSEDVFVAEIPVSQFFRSSDNKEVGEIDITGFSYKDQTQRADHYTQIRLLKLSDRALHYFSALNSSKKDSKTPKDVFAPLRWELQEDLPLQYSEFSPLYQYLRYEEPIGIQVFLNDVELHRNDVSGEVLDSGEINVGGIRAKYAFITPWKVINQSSRWVKLRVKNVGVGKRDNYGLGPRNYAYINWLSGEVQILEGVELTMNRDDFIITPDYTEFISVIGAKLRKLYTRIEDVMTSSKSLASTVRGGKQRVVAPKREVIETNIRKLESHGFTIERSPRNSNKTPAVSISQVERKVVVVDNHPDLLDTATIRGKEYGIRYENAGLDSRPCWFDRDNIVVNTAFPYFRSRRYGELFKRFHVAVLVASKLARSQASMFNILQDILGEDFRDFLN